ncbi:uncharacterized protein EI90DRAFT_3000268 [Cantharellus anzutake]|uniref:uncharacterized protein n=1 Tax=Cantharellus anzutake TaxID=1750568 RepID=UPI001908F378|nr:uncharacterized protein EI90DRAFT_2940040 [Cantharellus anzutake]XP_038911874.1 uncharacterized protein EI90DRAFT_3000268 [Cantharellus anzutake]KAF8319847.1 hypothetical protein EI90DRAFT_2940040 [Cantharellus anzutake]KAF8324878.1 hypothetical protein EI90DRAFT_3000268 [Cantharellus anzutake]
MASTVSSSRPIKSAAPRSIPPELLDVIAADFHQVNFAVEDHIKKELNLKLDKDDQICQANLTPGGCPLGASQCPLRHTTPSALNFQPPPPPPTSFRERERLSTVCKHWLRGLCKKGDTCEFLHEYNLRRMPECWWFATYGYCASGDECLYNHPKERKVECPDYKRGFCELGPTCPRKHVRRIACQRYLNGFCPLGPKCDQTHPKPRLPKEEEYLPPPPPSNRDLGPPPASYLRMQNEGQGQVQSFGGPGIPTGVVVNDPQNRPLGPDGTPMRRNLDEVLCFKCSQYGHYANTCSNRNVPGNRGGLDRRTLHTQE